MYFECRKRAAETNDRLRSRASAAEYLGISESSLAHYELGITKSVPVDVVVMMAELYNAPELKNHYCKTECPIGKQMPIATDVQTLEAAAVHLLGSLDTGEIEDYARRILRIASDGKVTEDERAETEAIIKALERICTAVSELKIITDRHRKGKREL